MDWESRGGRRGGAVEGGGCFGEVKGWYSRLGIGCGGEVVGNGVSPVVTETRKKTEQTFL